MRHDLRQQILTRKYDVFVSFRGEDVRNNFVDHLFGALTKNDITIFKDDTKLNKGEAIAPQLLHAIEGSRVLIVVFSKNYASSTWCLRELTKIVDCLNLSTKQNCVLPIFYDVAPCEVRKQKGNYEKAFDEHEEMFKGNIEMMVQIQKWKEALTQVANLCGWNLQNKPLDEEIKQIVEEVTSILGGNSSIENDDLDEVNSSLEQQLNRMSLGSQVVVRNVRIFEINVMEKNNHQISCSSTRSRSCSRESNRSRSRESNRSRSRESNRSRSRESNRSRSRESNRSHSRESNRSRSRERNRSRSRESNRSRNRESNRSRSCKSNRSRSCKSNRSRSRESNRSRSCESNHTRSRGSRSHSCRSREENDGRSRKRNPTHNGENNCSRECNFRKLRRGRNQERKRNKGRKLRTKMER